MTDTIVRLPAATESHPLRPAVWRVRQFIASISSQPDAEVDLALRDLLGDDRQWDLLAVLTPFDRSHHLRVHQELVWRGYSDPDLLRAALLHDVGKADGMGRAGVAGRSLRVVLRRIPSLLSRLTREQHPRLLHGLYLAEHHAQIGAERVRLLGVSERCCRLIAQQEYRDAGDDQLLSALIAADDAVIR